MAPFLKTLADMLSRLESGPKPTVALVTGYCLGGGLELALSCNHLIIGGKATLGLPEVTHGFLPAAGGLLYLALTFRMCQTSSCYLSPYRIKIHYGMSF